MTIHGASDTLPPTDLELMLYADGELGEERLAAVQEWLERELDGADARNKLTALGMVSDLIRAQGHEGAREGLRTPDIADAVMRRITMGGAEGPLVTMGGAEVPPQTPPFRSLATAGVEGPKGSAGKTPSRAANDNARGFYLIASAAVAAAAAVLLWTRPPVPVPHGEVTQLTAPPSVISSKAAVEPVIDHGVEVAAVDFGSRMGAVFYVPDGTSASSTTTVVWLSDDSAGEKNQ